jgi:hypothetical protein
MSRHKTCLATKKRHKAIVKIYTKVLNKKSTDVKQV